MRLPKKFIFIACVLALIEVKPLQASPWVMPDNLLIRHDIQILVDSGALNIPISTWPIAWGDIAYNLTKNESEMSLIEIASFQRIKDALIDAEMGGLSGQTDIKVAKNPTPFTWFNDTVTYTKSAGAQSTFLSKNLAINLKVEKIPGDTLFNESYLSIARGNYSIDVGSKKRWWGPGWGNSLVLSTNANAIKGLAIERTFSDPFESRFLKWIGPWDFSIMTGELNHSRTVPDPRFFGMRFDFRPIPNLELGLSRTSIFCGETQSCGFSGFTDMLLDKDNSGYNSVSFDFRSSHVINETPLAFYGQVMGEPFKDSMGLFGFETWGLIDSFAGLESYRVFIEASSTSCEFYKSNSSKYGCAYRNDVYVDGYQYDNANIGHSSDGDSITLSLGGFLVANNSQLIKSKITMGQLNRGSVSSYQLKENRTNFFNFMLGYNFDLYWFDIPLGSFDLGLGYDIFKDKVNNSSENEPRVFIAWSNSTDFSQEKTRDFSEYLELIEVSEEDKLLASEGITKVKTDSFTDFGNLDLFEIIDVLDQVSIERGDTSILAKVSIGIQSADKIISEIDSLSKDGKTLSDYLGLIDSTISQRN